MTLVPVLGSRELSDIQRQVLRCPTCLRPFDIEQQHSYEYFRSLGPATPRLMSRDDSDEGDSWREPTGAAPEENDESEHDAPGYYQKYFVELRKVGQGSFGGVFVARHVVEGNTLGLFAVKKIPVGCGGPYLDAAINEVRLLEELHRHPNVIEYKHSWIETSRVADFGPRVRCLFVLMEYASEGSLDSYMETHGRNLSDIAVWYFFLHALCGLRHLHSKHVLHRDIKPDNLLLTRDAADDPPRVVLSDFGTAAVFDELNPTNQDRTGGTGTVDYMAPELLASDSSGRYSGGHSIASDVWAMGQVLHWLAFNGALAVVNERRVQLNEATDRPPEMINLMKCMLNPNPQKRPTCNEILSTPLAARLLKRFESKEWMEDSKPCAHPLLLRDRSFRSVPRNRIETAPASPVEAQPKSFSSALPEETKCYDGKSNTDNQNLMYVTGGAIVFCVGVAVGRCWK